MRIVLDTNLLISGALTPTGTTYRAFVPLLQQRVKTLYDDRIVAEYKSVPTRPKFAGTLSATTVDRLIRLVLSVSERADTTGIKAPSLIDPKDAPFVEVALAGQADAIVMGNRKRFASCGMAVLSPIDFLQAMGLR